MLHAPAVAYVYVQDVASSWDRYERVAAGLVDPPPAGLILHVAGPTDEGVRIIDVWDSEEACADFRAERLEPAIGALRLSRSQPTVRELRPEHVVLWEKEER